MQRKDSLLIYIFGLAFIFGLFYVISEHLYLFWTTWWSDKVMHFIGGTVLSMMVIWVLYSLAEERFSRNKKASGSIAFFFVIIVTAIWKALEQRMGISDSTQGNTVDFILDFAFGAAGACAGYMLATGKKFKKNG